ncbi:MAG: hypothetical protein ACLR7Z_11025 [Bilophila wadsworthia]
MSLETHMRRHCLCLRGLLSLVLINGIITFMLTPGQGWPPETGGLASSPPPMGRVWLSAWESV